MDIIRPIPLCIDLDSILSPNQDSLQEFELKALTPEDLDNLEICPEMDFQSARDQQQ